LPIRESHLMSGRASRLLLPIIVFLVFSAIALLLWEKQNQYERDLVLRYTEGSAEQMRVRVESLMKVRVASLELLADRWVERRPPDFSRDRFLQFARTFFRHYPGFTAINWMDPDGLVRWVFPEETNAIAKDKTAYAHPDPRYLAAFERAKKSHQEQVTPCLEVYQGGMGFDVFVPLVHDGQIQGYLDGVFQVERLMATSLAKELVEQFSITLREDGRIIYRSGGEREKKGGMEGLPVVRPIDFRSKAWQLEIEPQAVSATVNFVPLVFGFGLSAALSVLLYFLFQRMEMFKEARDQALREVGERKRVEQSLRTNEKKLETLLSELAAKNAELEAFVYTVSHDLKTPIVTIEGFVGALREDFGDNLSAKGEEYLKFMTDAAKKMELLINDLLELSRVGRLAEKKTRFPFSEVVQESLATVRPLVQARGIEVTVGENLPVVYGDRKRMVQVLDNLLANAVKYIGKDNPSPRIDIGVAEKNGQKAFFVRDNGIGIESGYFEKIFQIFQRLPSAKRAAEGTGIGLTIVRRIIECHGGKIWLTSEPGKGSTFFFTLEEGDAQT
jgi:signal transduction histidine kinase